ncbi:MAG: transglycosylase SLT domain-containing protein [Candidatus Anaerobiospirillum merdipullorum]|uniref:Transglycosylase SLT domain-containing protein n=1 Tax=Candidatus Anaerobiospirillum merdipullorum TaxID=2838450 RepID=A0A9E2KP00_9GAMM|nr:transglycosylase SLT domain-containing protein [Candidatus Anaerobiospirillum merdipullorum]
MLLRYKKAVSVLFIAAQLCVLTPSYAGEKSNLLAGTVYEQVGVQENLDPFLLYSISLLESAGHSKSVNRGYIAPSPYAIRGPEGAFYPQSYAEAVKILNQQISKHGRRKLDIGLMQINGQHWLEAKHPESLFNPYNNVRLGAKILMHGLKDGADLELAIGRYHSPTDWRARIYGARVLAVYSNLRGFR